MNANEHIWGGAIVPAEAEKYSVHSLLKEYAVKFGVSVSVESLRHSLVGISTRI